MCLSWCGAASHATWRAPQRDAGTPRVEVQRSGLLSDDHRRLKPGVREAGALHGALHVADPSSEATASQATHRPWGSPSQPRSRVPARMSCLWTSAVGRRYGQQSPRQLSPRDEAAVPPRMHRVSMMLIDCWVSPFGMWRGSKGVGQAPNPGLRISAITRLIPPTPRCTGHDATGQALRLDRHRRK